MSCEETHQYIDVFNYYTFAIFPSLVHLGYVYIQAIKIEFNFISERFFRIPQDWNQLP